MSSHRQSRARSERNDGHSSGPNLSKRSAHATNGALSDDGNEYGFRGKRIKSSPSQDDRLRSITEFQTGAIVRVLVENFVTYEHAEFKPGPNLNMVIGPNGTGKSSLVCAICLGLGFHPKHLGRASNVGEFVKYGKEAATVEIELQSPPEERSNYVIRMQIRKEDNKTKWWINGHDRIHKDVKELTNKLRIQIDNLCQFLPQDRVAEFAGLTPVQLLHETLRAAAPERMTEWHDRLKELYKKYKDLKSTLDERAETLKSLEARQQGSQADVDRLREREAIQTKIHDLGRARAIADYQTIRRLMTDAKQRKHGARGRLKELEDASGPALQAVTQKVKYQKSIDAVVGERKKALRDAERACDQLLQAIEAQDEQIKVLQNKKDAEGTSHATKRSDLAKIRRTITDLEARLQNKPPEFVGSEWNQKIRQQEHLLRENEAAKRTLRTEFEELKDLNVRRIRERVTVEKDLEALNSQDGQKLAHLKKLHPDAAKGWEWLQAHKDEFEKEVFGPPMLNCSVTEKRLSDQIQSLLAFDDFFCFTCQTRNDHTKLSAQFFKQLGISVSIRTCGNDFASFRPAIPKEQVRAMGLAGYAIEYLEGPDPVLAMLCSEKRMHVSGVGYGDVSNDQYDQIANSGQIPSWATAVSLYRIAKRREYGEGAVSTFTRRVGPGRFWTDQPVDNAERTALRRRIDELNDEVEELKRQGQEKKARIQEIDNSDEPLRQQIEALRKEKNELQRAATQYATLGDKIAAEKKLLEDTQKELAECRERIFQYSAQGDQLILKKARSVLEHKEQLSEIRGAYQALLEAQIRLIEAQSDVQSLTERNARVMQELDEKKVEVGRVEAEIVQLKERAAIAKERVSAAVNGADDQLIFLTQLAGDKTVEEIDIEIGAESTKLELIHGVDPAILRQYEKRAQDILKLTQEKEDMNAKLESYNGRIQSVKERWEPAVDEVIRKINDAFSYNFEQINCAGEVGIHKDEDFEQWSIEIKVKFRENETLQQLNQHRQSGGERAVSTIFYLMALQSMAQAPFRVVDEINQGMDPRNERMVHERMVEIACREHTSQYFLITPKLLTGLRYDERMHILCIASGEHMPAAEDAKKLDFENIVSKARQRLVSSAA